MKPPTRRKKLPAVPAEGFYFHEATHNYFFDGKPMTGCTTVLSVLAKPALIPWAAKMATEYIRANVSYAIPGPEGGYWAIKPSVVDEARTAHAKKRDTAADAGTDIHALIEAYVNVCIDTNEGEAFALPHEISVVAAFVEWAVKENIRFIATEQRLYSKSLWVAGTADLIFLKDGKRYIGDIKTFKKIWDRVPLIQCAGYALMWEEMQIESAPLGQVMATDEKIDGYVIICLPKERAFNEAEDVLWSFDTEGDTEAFRAAVRLHRYLNQK